MSAKSLDANLQRIEALDLDGLRAEWRTLFGPPPKLRSVELMRRLILWRIEGEGDAALVEALSAKLNDARSGRAASVLMPGDVVYREWQGVRHEATVLENGQVAYGGRSFESLSAVARTITGSRWNGPRFFGLRSEPT